MNHFKMLVTLLICYAVSLNAMLTKEQEAYAISKEMMEALETGNIAKVKELSAANPFTYDANFNTPLYYAVMFNKIDVVKTLLDSGARDVNIPNKQGETPFMAAVKLASPNIVKVLLDAGANIYVKDLNGKTVFDFQPLFPEVKGVLEKYQKLQSPEHKKALREAAQNIISGRGPRTAQQTAGQTIQEFLR